MNFSIPAHNSTGCLDGDDLKFFYYDIGLDHLQSWPKCYDWDSVVAKFKDRLEIEACPYISDDKELVLNRIRFTVSNAKKSDAGSKAAAFFRHLRNAFAHYTIVREGNNYVITDISTSKKSSLTMKGFVDARLLKEFCFYFFDYREKILSEYGNHDNPTL